MVKLQGEQVPEMGADGLLKRKSGVATRVPAAYVTLKCNCPSNPASGWRTLLGCLIVGLLFFERAAEFRLIDWK
jgi:hypothetical protein